MNLRWAIGAFVVSLLPILSGCQQESVLEKYADFNALALEVTDGIAVGDGERLVAQTDRVRIVCDQQLIESAAPCQGMAVGATTQGFDVEFYGREETILDGEELRLLLEGMAFGSDLQAPADQFGGPGIRVFSTRVPDTALWFDTDDPESLPQRGDIAITYIGRSPSEDDQVKRRLWAAVAEKGDDGTWRIRLWLVGFFRPDHPALNPSEGNGFKAWSPPATEPR